MPFSTKISDKVETWLQETSILSSSALPFQKPYPGVKWKTYNSACGHPSACTELSHHGVYVLHILSLPPWSVWRFDRVPRLETKRGNYSDRDGPIINGRVLRKWSSWKTFNRVSQSTRKRPVKSSFMPGDPEVKVSKAMFLLEDHLFNCRSMFFFCLAKGSTLD